MESKEKQKFLEALTEKYTKRVMFFLYRKKCHVFFRIELPNEAKAIFRDKNTEPGCYEDIPIWQKNQLCSITYEIRLLDAPDLWRTIVHECSHYEIGVTRRRHTKEFCKIYKKNSTKTKELRKQFFREKRALNSIKQDKAQVTSAEPLKNFKKRN